MQLIAERQIDTFRAGILVVRAGTFYTTKIVINHTQQPNDSVIMNYASFVWQTPH